MADAFLHELLQMRNRAADQCERCAICMEEYGSLSRDTGSIEAGMRLPCDHSIGSACIATWLKDHNSCPICRCEFFPAQPRPYLEHGIMDNQLDNYPDELDNHADDTEDSYQPNIGDLNYEFCAGLGLEMPIPMVSMIIIRKLAENETWTSGHNHWCMVAVGVYIASFLTGQARSPREIAPFAGVSADHIRFTYDSIYPDRFRLADDELLPFLESAFDDALPVNWPAPGYELTDEGIENSHVALTLKKACEDGCGILELDLRLLNKVVEFSNRIAEGLHAKGFMIHLSPKEVAAVAVFAAGHMLGHQPFAWSVAEAVGVSERRVRSGYRIAYENRHRLVEEAWLEGGDMDSVLRRLPLP